MPILRRRSKPRSSGRRRLRRMVMLGAIAGAVGAFRNKKIEENRQRYNLP